MSARLSRIVAAELRTQRQRQVKLESEESISGVVAGRFELQRVLGEGGQAITYLAEDKQTGTQVALKRLSLAGADDWKAVELFEREGHVLEQLNHEAIPRYLAAFEVDQAQELGGFYLAQEYVAGESLDHEIARGRRYEEAEIRTLLREVLLVLVYLHQRHPPVVHRDIKPSNLIRRLDGRLALIDFGAIQAALPTNRGGSTIIGTSGYMAPEQFMGAAEPATDLYGLGATAVHLLTNRHPADMPLERMRLKWHDSVRGVSKALIAYLDRLLEPALEDRFGSAGEALRALEVLGRGELVAVAPTPLVQQRQTGWRNHAPIAVLILVVAVLAVLSQVLIDLNSFDRSVAVEERASHVGLFDGDQRLVQPGVGSERPSSFDGRAARPSNTRVPVSLMLPPGAEELTIGFGTSYLHPYGNRYVLGGRIDNNTQLSIRELTGRARLYDSDGTVVASGEVNCWPSFRPPLLPGQSSACAVRDTTVNGQPIRAEIEFHTFSTGPPVLPGKTPIDTMWDTAPLDGAALSVSEREFTLGRVLGSTYSWAVEVEHTGSIPMCFVQLEARFYDQSGERMGTVQSYVSGSEPLEPGMTTPVKLDFRSQEEPYRRELAVIGARLCRANH